MVVVYLMKLRSMSFEQALAFVVERRPMANPNESFRQQLQEYGRRLQRSAPKEKSARAVRGPVGPQLPPAAAAEGNSGGEEHAADIRPQLPPHLIPAREADRGDDMAEKTEVAVQGDKDKGGKIVIGPSLPPNLKRQRVEANELEQEDKTSTKKKKIEGSD